MLSIMISPQRSAHRRAWILITIFIGTFSFTSAVLDWHQIGQDFFGDAPNLNYGRSVSMSSDGHTIAISSPRHDNNGETQVGAVYTYFFKDQTWQQIGNPLFGESSNGFFGWSVSLSADGKTLAVGTDKYDSKTMDNVGKITLYSFNQDSDEWEFFGEKFGDSKDDNFGEAVAMSGDGTTVAVGVPLDYNNNKGSVKTYSWNGDWSQMGTTIDGLSKDNNIGVAIAISEDGKRLVVGNPKTKKGSIRIFQYDSDWVQLKRVIGRKNGDEFGASVSISPDGKSIAIGAIQASDGKGSVTVYKEGSTEFKWRQVKPTLTGGNENDEFGTSVAIVNTMIVAVGATKHDTSSIDNGCVAIYNYVESEETWAQVGSMLTGENAFEKFGMAISVDSALSRIIVGIPDISNSGQFFTGGAKTYAYYDDDFPFTNMPTVSPTKNPTVPPTKNPTHYPTSGAWLLGESNVVMLSQNEADGQFQVELSVGEGPDRVSLRLYKLNCVDTIFNNEIITIVSQRYLRNANIFRYVLDIKEDLVESSAIVEFDESSNTGNSVGTISFCTKVTTILDEGSDTIDVTYRDTNFKLNFNLADNTFDLDSVTTSEDDITLVEEVISTNYAVTLCVCSAESFDCINNPSAITYNEKIIVCLGTNSESVEIENFLLRMQNEDKTYEHNSVWYGTNEWDYDPDITQVDTGTDSDGNTIVRVNTIAVVGVFDGVAPGSETSIPLSGNANLHFPGATSKSRTFEDFDTSILMKAPNSPDMGCLTSLIHRMTNRMKGKTI